MKDLKFLRTAASRAGSEPEVDDKMATLLEKGSLAVEGLLGQDPTVNMVSPGLFRGGTMPGVGAIDESRLGTFEDVAEAVAFCASDAAAAITGSNVIVSGTWKM